MFFMPRFANILLPLALEESLTYGIPSDLQLSVGQRVVVQLGKRKRYTGLVEKLHDEAPAEGRQPPHRSDRRRHCHDR